MSVDTMIENIVFHTDNEIINEVDYNETNNRIIKLQHELRTELSEEVMKKFMLLCDLESQSEAISSLYYCKKGLLQGIALGQSVKLSR